LAKLAAFTTVDAPKRLLRTGLLESRAEAAEDIIHRAERRVVEGLSSIQRCTPNHQFWTRLRRLSPADRDDANIALIGEQEIQAQTPDEPRRAEDCRSPPLCHSSPSNRILIGE
jgi:hypothetical protein